MFGGDGDALRSGLRSAGSQSILLLHYTQISSNRSCSRDGETVLSLAPCGDLAYTVQHRCTRYNTSQHPLLFHALAGFWPFSAFAINFLCAFSRILCCPSCSTFSNDVSSAVPHTIHEPSLLRFNCF